MAEAITDPTAVPYGAAPGITIHVLRENKRPVGFAPWPKEPKRKKKEKKT